jgi:hypothetical protein
MLECNKSKSVVLVILYAVLWGTLKGTIYLMEAQNRLEGSKLGSYVHVRRRRRRRRI